MRKYTVLLLSLMKDLAHLRVEGQTGLVVAHRFGYSQKDDALPAATQFETSSVGLQSLLHAQRSTELPVVARDTGSVIVECPESAPQHELQPALNVWYIEEKLVVGNC
eukprot:6180353-Pleurochrysis_carterae.AAC.3